jgi:hypothetical protein
MSETRSHLQTSLRCHTTHSRTRSLTRSTRFPLAIRALACLNCHCSATFKGQTTSLAKIYPPLELHTNCTHYEHSTQCNVQLQCVIGQSLGSLLGPVYLSFWSQVAGRVSSDSEGGNIAHAQSPVRSHTLSNGQVKEDAVQQRTGFKRRL